MAKLRNEEDELFSWDNQSTLDDEEEEEEEEDLYVFDGPEAPCVGEWQV